VLRECTDITRPKMGHLGVILLNELRKGELLLQSEFREGEDRIGMVKESSTSTRSRTLRNNINLFLKHRALISPSMDPFEALKYVTLLGS
jgi:hypothetical protein